MRLLEHNQIMLSQEVIYLEDSLKEYLIDIHVNDPFERENFNIFKYRGLKVLVGEGENIGEPNFSVQLGIFEARFSIETGEKISGGFGTTDEYAVKKWLEIGSNKQLLKLAWAGLSELAYDKTDITPFDME